MKKILGILAMVMAPLFMSAEDKPSYPGGEEALAKYLSENVRYPEISKENGVEGIVVVGFTVNTDGSLANLKVVKFVDPDLEKEALRVVGGMPAWVPADKDGSAVAAPAQVDVPFLLD